MLLLKYLRNYRFLTVMRFMIEKRCSSMLTIRILIQLLPSLTLYFSDASYISSTCKTALIGCHPQSGGIYRLVETTVSSGTICLDCCLMQLSLREQDRMMLSHQLPRPKWTLILPAEPPHPRIVPERSNSILSLLQKKLGPYFVTSELTGRYCVHEHDGAVVFKNSDLFYTNV